jgi:AraC-like DNA-binding protein
VLKLPYAKKEESHKHHVLEKAIIYIKENFAEDINLNKIALHVNMSTGYFSHYFKKNIGISFVKYLNQFRLSKSLEHLLSSDELIIDIAYKCGFRNLSTYYQLFYETYAISPCKYRNQFQKNKK